MSTAAVDEFVKRARSILTRDEQKDLSRRLIEPEPEVSPNLQVKKNGQYAPENPNLTWIKRYKAKYAGNYVALKDGELIAFGRTIKEADQAAKAKGVASPFLHYIFPADYVPWGGW